MRSCIGAIAVQLLTRIALIAIIYRLTDLSVWLSVVLTPVVSAFAMMGWEAYLRSKGSSRAISDSDGGTYRSVHRSREPRIRRGVVCHARIPHRLGAVP